MPASDKAFEMPPIEVGRTVVWYQDSAAKAGAAGSHPAVVVSMRGNNVDLCILDAIHTQVKPESGVPHVDDPKVKVHADERGAWDYTEEDKRRMAWEAEVEKRIAAMEKTPLKKAS